MSISVVYDCGTSVSEDGYSKKPDAFHCHGIYAFNLKCSDYQELIDRNWRRSGKYIYKPDPSKCYSLQYTIRLDVHKYKPGRKHKRVLKQLLNYLNGVTQTKKPKEKKIKIQEKSFIISELEKVVHAALQKALEKENLSSKIKVEDNEVQVKPNKNKKFGDLFCSIGLRLSSLISKQTTLKLNASNISKSIVEWIPKTEFVEKINVSDNGMINFFLFEKYKKDIEMKQKRVDQKERKKEQIPATKHKLEVSLAPAKYTDEGFELYKKYQIAIHKDDPNRLTKKGYTEFLVDSPMSLERTGKERKFDLTDEIPELKGLCKVSFSGFLGYGTFHVQYRIDGKLIMVGVIDILPKCLSSVYVFYDPDCYSFMSPGVYSALAEILYVKNVSKFMPDLHYYYMGYYIHTCQKMIYKAQFQPSELLCPITYQYVPINDCISQVIKDNQENVKPADRVLRLSKTGEPEKVDDNVDDVLCAFMQNLMPFSLVKQVFRMASQSNTRLSAIENDLKKYKKLVGGNLAKKMAYIIREDE